MVEGARIIKFMHMNKKQTFILPFFIYIPNK